MRFHGTWAGTLEQTIREPYHVGVPPCPTQFSLILSTSTLALKIDIGDIAIIKMISRR
ncbi:MAG: hypothetical protein H0U75_09900 [Legionella sp.]|nr:hypothetical protein [Legionella sp.]